MRLPKGLKAKVGPHHYDVVFDQAAIDRIAAEQEDGRVGETDTELLRILVKPSMKPSVVRDTTLHEVLHAVTEMSGLSSELGRELDEKVVRVMAPVLLDCLRRSHRLRRFLFE